MLAQLESEFPGELRVAYRHFPLSSHDKAQLATQAAEAAGLQGKFWEMHDLLFAQRADWVDFTPEEFEPWLVERAGELDLDREKFASDLTSAAIAKLAQESWEKNAAIGMPGTPFMVVNGYPYNGPLDHGNLAATIRLILLEKKQFSECPQMTLDPDRQYFATLRTEKGEIKIELFSDRAPLAVNSFIFLARSGWFNGVTFHRVIEDYIAQAGDPSGTGFGGPGYSFDNETHSDLTFDGPGVVGMANAGAGTNGSQFFITLVAAPKLDGGYTIFGRVVSGMEIVRQLTLRDPSQNLDLPVGDVILGVTIEEK